LPSIVKKIFKISNNTINEQMRCYSNLDKIALYDIPEKQNSHQNSKKKACMA
jgi:hypothetical protein